MSGMIEKLRRTAGRLGGNRQGTGAVEFALIAPLLIVLYVGSLEISVAMSVNKKVARAASAIADLTTQSSDVDKAFLATMVDVGESIITPFNTSTLKLKISGISIDASKNAKVTWSWDQDNSRPYAVNSATTVPSELAIPNSFLVRTELQMDHKLLLVMPGLQDVTVNNLTMRKTYHLRQRIGNSVNCSNC